MIRIHTFGAITVTRDGQTLAGLATQPRRLAVLALVARAGERGISREKLLATLWPDSSEEGGRASLSQALSMLRRELADGDLFTGVQALRLNQASATADVLDFDAALAAGDLERAAAVYRGPFLEGFRVPGAPELERWVEEERGHLASRYADSLEKLGRQALDQGNPVSAVSWWKQRAVLDPLNARITLELMRALVAAGERHAAIQQARIYEALLAQELALEPDVEVVRLAQALRSAPSESPMPAAPVALPGPATVPAPAPRAADEPERPASPAPLVRRFYLRRSLVAILAGLGLVAVLALGLLRRPAPPVPASPLFAVGRIVDHRGTGQDDAAPLGDMIATNLARVPGIQVVSKLRLLELADRAGPAADPPAALVRAARAAGATEILEGELYRLPDGRLLLELRREDLGTSAVLAAFRLEGSDVFELVRQSVAQVSASLGRRASPSDSVERGTQSLVAYRFYQEGLAHFARGRFREARGLFDAALREDSSFFMAAYHRVVAGSSLGLRVEPRELEWLERLADRAPERERLLIRGLLAIAGQSPALLAIAETLTVRYPAELDGHNLLGYSRNIRGEFALAVPPLRRVLEQDSTGFTPGSVRCQACDAAEQLVYAYQALDSFARAEQLLRTWLARDSSSARAWSTLGGLLMITGRTDEAEAAWRRRTEVQTNPYDVLGPATGRLRAGDFSATDEIARGLLTSLRKSEEWEARWFLGISLRYQGRWKEALELMQARLAGMTRAEREGDLDYLPTLLSALILLDSQASREAARLVDSVARHPHPGARAGGLARRQVYQYLILAEAAYAMRDTELVQRAADSCRAWAARDGNPRDDRVADHAEALVHLSRHDTTRAMENFQRAIYSTTVGFTRSSAWMSRLLIARGRAAEAVPLLQAAFRGPFDNTNLYVTYTELHEELALAYEALGRRDSARVHWQWVARALAESDPGARARLERARNRAAFQPAGIGR